MRTGRRIRRVIVIGSSPESLRRFATSCWSIQFLIGVRVFSRASSSTRSAGRQSWL